MVKNVIIPMLVVHVVKSVITSSIINAHSRPQPWFVLKKCTDFWQCPILGHLFARIRHCVTRHYPRIRVHLPDRRTERERERTCAWLPVAAWEAFGHRYHWAPLSLFMCGLTSFVCTASIPHTPHIPLQPLSCVLSPLLYVPPCIPHTYLTHTSHIPYTYLTQKQHQICM